MDLMDEEAVSQLAFNIQWHYTLDITEESDSAKYLCPKTLWNMRSILTENALDALLFNVITGTNWQLCSTSRPTSSGSIRQDAGKGQQ
jgi:hypothetical protein